MAKNSVSSFGLGSRIPVKEAPAAEKEAKPVSMPAEEKPRAAYEQEERGALRPNSVIATAEDEETVLKRETRSQRVNLLVEPTNYKKLRKYLKKRDQSFNDFICTYIAEFVKTKGL